MTAGFANRRHPSKRIQTMTNTANPSFAWKKAAPALLVPVLCFFVLQLGSVSLVLAEKNKEGVIVAMGDSLTEGLGVNEDQAWPALVAAMLEKNGFNFTVINAGVSGETSSGALTRLDWILQTLSPDVVILETGANDGLRGLDLSLVQTNLDKLLFQLGEKNIQVVLAGMQMVKNLGRDYTEGFAAIYPEAARKHDAVLIPFFLENVGGVPRFNQADGIHPNAAGHGRIAETVYPYLVRAIEKWRLKK